MKLLVLLSRFPFPLDKGDKLRAYHQLRFLAAHHEVCLFALSDEAVSPEAEALVSPLCRGGLVVHRLRRPRIASNMTWALLAGRPLQVGYFHDAHAQHKIDALLQSFKPDHVYCQLIRMAEYLRSHAGQRNMTLDYMDVFSAGMARRATQAPRWQRRVFALEAKRLQAYETEAFGWFQHHTIISDQDRQLIQHPCRDQIQIVLNGIDTDFFKPQPDTPKKYDVLFCGNMGYHPNIDAACFLAEEIMPLVRQVLPDARLLVAGTTPAARVLALASAHTEVSGWVPDIREAYAASRVFVAAMRVGTGLQNKLLEAMAMRLPCVTTPLANNALGGTHGQELSVVAADASVLAEAITMLLSDAVAADKLAHHGHEFVKEHFTWPGATARLEALFC
ncbi:glycosyltransferase [Hymenobacter arizonensis]|uniref:Sugar transferase, PEP-CTERM/EpsH1 system associated n=1 Tax=Hymenobacter arizonensis TaxID=1227077 RepID=A0A1I5UAE2_HYMAR|nr:glycosyltransferase [Hymenobacter arizonensis]SFP92188.1 sugar transferase, PEP-CTERM/EpsH1 system associated [Hymenobacter arizonensis]